MTPYYVPIVDAQDRIMCGMIIKWPFYNVPTGSVIKKIVVTGKNPAKVHLENGRVIDIILGAKMDLREARELAAQAWCTETTKDKVMDVTLAEAFAVILQREVQKVVDHRAGTIGHMANREQDALNKKYGN